MQVILKMGFQMVSFKSDQSSWVNLDCISEIIDKFNLNIYTVYK